MKKTQQTQPDSVREYEIIKTDFINSCKVKKEFDEDLRNTIIKPTLATQSNDAFLLEDDCTIENITIKDLERINASGASIIKMIDPFTVNNLKIDISGASTLKGTIKSASISLDASGASAITLSGKSANANFDLSGASVVKASDFEIENCKVDASGASSVNVHVTKQLDAEASGASSIRYKGDANVKNSNSSGASSIRKRD
jgi:hypothetical protein